MSPCHQSPCRLSSLRNSHATMSILVVKNHIKVERKEGTLYLKTLNAFCCIWSLLSYVRSFENDILTLECSWTSPWYYVLDVHHGHQRTCEIMTFCTTFHHRLLSSSISTVQSEHVLFLSVCTQPLHQGLSESHCYHILSFRLDAEGGSMLVRFLLVTIPF